MATAPPPCRIPVRAQAAFTLIEVLIATGLSTLLILVAVITFQATATAMTRLDQLADENALIRIGYRLAMEDVDYWHSEANPAFPYLRGHQSETGPATAAADDQDPYDVRPFRPVTWNHPLSGSETDASPNSAHAHAPDSWYRGHLQHGQSTGIVRLRYANTKTYVYWPDWSMEDTDERLSFLEQPWYIDPLDGRRKAPTGEVLGSHFDDGISKYYRSQFKAWVNRMPGWNNWHLLGDYAMLQNIDGLYRTAATSDEPEPWRHARAKRFIDTFKQLGVRGLYEYGVPGELNLVTLSSVNERRWNYLARDGSSQEEIQADTHFRKGELPFALHTSHKTVGERKVLVLNGSRTSGDWLPYPQAFRTLYADYNRMNYATATPARNDPMHYKFAVFRRFLYLTDLGSINGHTWSTNVPEFSVEDRSAPRDKFALHGLLLPPNPRRTSFAGSTWDWDRFHSVTYNPLVFLDSHDENASVNNNGDLDEQLRRITLSADDQYRQVREGHTRTTWHQPINHTDDGSPDVTGDGRTSMKVATRLLRYRVAGNHKAEATVVIINPDTGLNVEMRIRALGTTLRGARQYWGRRALDGEVFAPDGSAVRLGDFYHGVSR